MPHLDAVDDEAQALLRRLLRLPAPIQLDLYRQLGDVLADDTPTLSPSEAAEQREGLDVLAAAGQEASLPPGAAPTARQFASSSARERGWTVARMRRVVGSWSAACDRPGHSHGVLAAGPRRQAALRSANRHHGHEREGYLHALRLWLATGPASTTAADYTAWRLHHNTSRRHAEAPAVSAVTIRNRLGRSWPDIVAIGRGSVTIEDTQPRDDAPHLRLHGPHDLIGTAELRQLTGLGVTALRILSYAPGFPSRQHRRAGVAREHVHELRFDVDTAMNLVDRRARDNGVQRRIGRQLRARVDVHVRVEHLTLHPHRQHRRRRSHRRRDDEREHPARRRPAERETTTHAADVVSACDVRVSITPSRTPRRPASAHPHV
jgi:hypothetical protein